MKRYEEALALLQRVSALMEDSGETLIVAHLATPISLIEMRVAELRTQSE